MGQLTSGFGSRGGRQHLGADYASPSGSPIYANGPMTVTGVYPDGSPGQSGYGNTVTLRDQYGTEYRHAHLAEVPNLQPGQQVGAGDLVGKVGNTGNSSGPHDHYEVSTSGNINGKQGMADPESTDPNTGKAYSDAFSMDYPTSGSLNSARADGKQQPQNPTAPPGETPAPTAQQQTPSVLQSGKRVHRLTDRNNANGVIDECVAKTVFVNNLNISVDGSKGTRHPADGAQSPGGTPAPEPSPDGTNNPAGTGHCQHCWMTANGSRCVFAENIPVNFEGNFDTCGHVRIEGSPDVYVGDCVKSTDNALGADRPARNHKEPSTSGNASASNIACRQQEIDNVRKNADPKDPNFDGPQQKADLDDPNKPVDGKPGVKGDGQADSEQASRQRLLKQLDQDYANRDQWAGGKSSPAGSAAFDNIGKGNVPNGTPWCAAYVHSNLKDSGAGYVGGDGNLGSISPTAFKPVQPGQAQPGDVLVFSGHTAFVKEVYPNGDILLQGGNQAGNRIPGGGVTQSVIKASDGYNFGNQSLVGVYNPHDKEWNDSHNLNVVPTGQNRVPYGSGKPGVPIGQNCPTETKEEAAQRPGESNAGDPGLFPPGLPGDLGRSPDPVFGDPGSPGATSPQTDPMVLAHQYYQAALDDSDPPPYSELSTYGRARQLAITATGNPNPSGADIQRYIPQAQKQWWDETLAANQYRYEPAVESYRQAGVADYRVPSPGTVTTMMAYQSGWGNSRGLPNTAYEQNNPLGLGWNGSSWYNYPTKQDGIDASWKFLAFGGGGSQGRYLVPSSTPIENSFELKKIYGSGFIDGNVPPAVLLIKPPQ